MTAGSYRVEVTTTQGDYSWNVAALDAPGAVKTVMNALIDTPSAWEGDLRDIRVRWIGQLGVGTDR